MPDPSEEAFEAFVDAHAAVPGRLAHQLTGEHDSALDLVQDVLVRVPDKWTKVLNKFPSDLGFLSRSSRKVRDSG